MLLTHILLSFQILISKMTYFKEVFLCYSPMFSYVILQNSAFFFLVSYASGTQAQDGKSALEVAPPFSKSILLPV